ncbi:MAG: NADH-quinone oxidoreductase subunit N [Phycisphaerales bacterium]|nr:NADH-quinone oxidoreductase subunit N [Phycisphaerales bacterium]
MSLLAASMPIIERLSYLKPEMALGAGACVVMMLGLSPKRSVRLGCEMFSIFALLAAFALALFATPAHATSALPNLMPFAKAMIAAVGVVLVMALSGTVDRDVEARAERTGKFDKARSTRGEFYSFFLFSLMGLMLCASADDLIWLFLALELTSLPTYVMVSISTARRESQEAGVKYFFLGAFGAATFLFGFAMLFGSAGTTQLFGAGSIAEHLLLHGIGPIAMLGIVMSIIGVSFKIAAVPMHFYTPDVYQGAATPVSAMLAFVPKAAGFITLMLLLSAVGWRYGAHGDALPEAIRVLLWVMAALTMTVGNVLAWLQTSVKRMLAYSSVAHSGYMIVGLIAGPGDGSLASNGLAAVLFYLMAYGFTNVGAFAVLSALEHRSGREADSIDDIRGLWKTQPMLAVVMAVCVASLLGLPPLLGFFGKLFLFTSAIGAGEIALVVVLGLNSAVAAYYYLRIIGLPMLKDPDAVSQDMRLSPFPARTLVGVVSAASAVLLVAVASQLMQASNNATAYSAVVASGSDVEATPVSSVE